MTSVSTLAAGVVAAGSVGALWGLARPRASLGERVGAILVGMGVGALVAQVAASAGGNTGSTPASEAAADLIVHFAPGGL